MASDAYIDRIRTALTTLYPYQGFEAMADDTLRSAVVAAAAASPKSLNMEDAVRILERLAARHRRESTDS